MLEKIQWLLGSKYVGGLLGVLLDICLGSATDVGDVGSHMEGVGSGRSKPLAVLLVIRGKVAHGDSHLQRLALTWLQRACLGKLLQLLCRNLY